MNLNHYRDLCHVASVKAGWWTDLETGEKIKRNKGEMLMLVVTEVNEWGSAFWSGIKDDHLPKYESWIVELADIVIRLADYAGGFELDLNGYETQTCHNLDINFIRHMVRYLSEAMESQRKGQDESRYVAQAMQACLHLSKLSRENFNTVIADKMAYNAQRADHKLENRRKQGGKKC